MYISTFGRRNSTNGNLSLTSFLAVCDFLWLSTGTLYSSEYIYFLFFFTEMLHFTFFINHIKCISDNNYSYVFPQVMMIRLQRLFQWTSSVLLKDVYVNYALTKKVMKKVTNDVFSKYFVKTLTNLFQKIISFCSVIKWTNQWCGWSGICCQHLRLSWWYIPNIRH